MSMLLIAISIAAGLLVAQGLALTVAAWGGKLCCCRQAHDGKEEAEHERARRRKRQGQGIVDSVYF